MRLVTTETAESLFADDETTFPMGCGKDFEYGTCDNEFTFVCAEKSGLVYLSGRPNADELSTIYPDHYEPYRFEAFPPLLRWARSFVQRGKVTAVRRLAPRGARILDVGCGSGLLLRLLRTHGDPSWVLSGNDIHAPSLQRLRGEGFITHVGPVDQIEGHALFDVIVLNQVIEHFSDVKGLVQTCSRLLRPGGHLLVETPSTSGWDFDLFQARHWGGYHFPRHFYLFNAQNLARLLEEYGLAVQETTYLASPAFWTQSMHHRVSESRFRGMASWFHLRNIPLTALVTAVDLVRIAVGLKTSNMRMVGTKPATSAATAHRGFA